MARQSVKLRAIVAGLSLVIGLALCIVAWPRLVGGAIVAPYEDILRTVARGAQIAPEVLDDARQSSRLSGEWIPQGRTLSLLGGLELLRARMARTPAEQRKSLNASIAAFRSGLAHAPANTYVWLQLAQALQARDGARAAVNGPVRMSLLTAPFEHRVVLPRIDIVLRGWRVIEPDIRAAMVGQFQRAVDTAPLPFAKLTRRRFALRQVRRALASSPVHLERFNIVYLTPD